MKHSFTKNIFPYLKNYYKQYDMTNTHQKKFTWFVNLLIANGNTMRISKEELEKGFSNNYFNKIYKEFSITYDLETFEEIITFKKTENPNNQTLLFHKLFKRTDKGDNLRHIYNEYSLKNIERLDEILNDYDKIPYMKYIEAEILSHNQMSNLLHIDKKSIIKYIKDNQSIYGTNAENIFGLSDNQFIKRKADYQLLKQIIDTIDRYDIKIIYDIKESGRRYTRIQGMTKELRKVLLKDYIENDINGSAPNYFIQVFNKITLADNSTLLKEYKNKIKKYDYDRLTIVDNMINCNINLLEYYTSDGKSNIRSMLANILKTEDNENTLGLAKELLTMVFFGAKTNSNIIEIEEDGDIIQIFKTSIQERLTKEQQKKFFNDSLVKEFLITSEIVMDIINLYLKQNYLFEKIKGNKTIKYLKINGRELTYDDGESEYYITHNGKKIIIDEENLINKKQYEYNNIMYQVKKSKKRYSKSKALAFMYQSWESNTLGLMEKVYTKESGLNSKDKRYLLIHDGIYTKVKINKETLENLNAKENTFSINYSIEQS